EGHAGHVGPSVTLVGDQRRAGNAALQAEPVADFRGHEAEGVARTVVVGDAFRGTQALGDSRARGQAERARIAAIGIGRTRLTEPIRRLASSGTSGTTRRPAAAARAPGP